MQLYPTQFMRTAEVINEHPDTLFIINHAGTWVDHNLDGTGPSMAIKSSIYTVLDTFGTDRAMFASNFR